MKNEPAFPVGRRTEEALDANRLEYIPNGFPGLSKRELFAAMAMQGNLACPLSMDAAEKVHEMGQDEFLLVMAESAVRHADALLAELEK